MNKLDLLAKVVMGMFLTFVAVLFIWAILQLGNVWISIGIAVAVFAVFWSMIRLMKL